MPRIHLNAKSRLIQEKLRRSVKSELIRVFGEGMFYYTSRSTAVEPMDCVVRTTFLLDVCIGNWNSLEPHEKHYPPPLTDVCCLVALADV